MKNSPPLIRGMPSARHVAEGKAQGGLYNLHHVNISMCKSWQDGPHV